MIEFLPASCRGERCRCGSPAVAKVEEHVFDDDPAPYRHPLTAYLCREHFVDVMGEAGVAAVDAMREGTATAPFVTVTMHDARRGNALHRTQRPLPAYVPLGSRAVLAVPLGPLRSRRIRALNIDRTVEESWGTIERRHCVFYDPPAAFDNDGELLLGAQPWDYTLVGIEWADDSPVEGAP